MYICMMAHVTPKEEAALNEIMQTLEAEPVEATASTSLVSLTNDDNIPAQREKLAILVSIGKAKEAIGHQNSTRTTSLPRSCQPLLGALHFALGDFWH